MQNLFSDDYEDLLEEINVKELKSQRLKEIEARELAEQEKNQQINNLSNQIECKER